jgi:hypothetical protein
MANAVNTNKSLTGIAAKVGAAMLRNALGFTASVDKEDEATFGQNFKSVQPGDTIYVTKHPRYTVRTNATFSAQDVTDEKVALTVDQRRGVDFNFTSAEIATDMQIKSWAERVVAPAARRIAEEVEKYNLQLASQAAYMMVGTAGTSPATSGVFLQARERVLAQACADDGRLMAVIPPSVNTTMVPALQGLFLPNQQIGDQFRNGYLGKTTLGLDFMTSNLAYTHTNGTAVAQSVLVNGAVSTNGVSTIAVDAITGTNTLTKGTVFTIANVYDVNPVTKAQLPNLKQFVVTADTAATAGAIASLPIAPTLYFSGTLQNVSTTIADNAALTFTSGATASSVLGNSLVYHPSAIRFCSVPLVNPEQGVIESHTETVEGISMRALKFYDGSSDQVKMRLDIQFGTAIVRPEHLCRVTS